MHLQLKTEEDAGPYIAEKRAQIVTRKEFEYQLKVTGQEQANDLLARLTQGRGHGGAVQPAGAVLHEIFVETVGVRVRCVTCPERARYTASPCRSC